MYGEAFVSRYWYYSILFFCRYLQRALSRQQAFRQSFLTSWHSLKHQLLEHRFSLFLIGYWMLLCNLNFSVSSQVYCCSFSVYDVKWIYKEMSLWIHQFLCDRGTRPWTTIEYLATKITAISCILILLYLYPSTLISSIKRTLVSTKMDASFFTLWSWKATIKKFLEKYFYFLGTL